MSKPRILIQLDGDRHASVFDAVVAVDSDVDKLLQYGSVLPDDVQNLVHGAMFTRGVDDLNRTAVFVGGADVAAGEMLLKRVTGSFFGSLRVSVMLDANGANTTAAAAVVSAAKHTRLNDAKATVLAATGPVGQRVARLLAREGATVRVASRSEAKAAAACDAIRAVVSDANLESCSTADATETAAAISGADIVIAAGAAGIELVSAEARSASSPAVAIDLNAVPPPGIGGIEVTDRARDRDGTICYGAIGVGGMKMKIHKAAIRKLFESNEHVLDAEEIFAIAKELSS